MTKIKHNFPSIVVEWADHYSTPINESYSVEDVEKMLKPFIRVTKGYLVGENRRVIAVASTLEEDGSVTDIDILMKRAIISREDN